ALGVDALQRRVKAVEPQSRRCRVDRLLGQVDAEALAPGARPLQMIGARADADLEDLLAAVPRELREAVDERLEPVAVLLDRFEPFARTPLERPCELGVRAAGAGFPEGADLIVERGHRESRIPRSRS